MSRLWLPTQFPGLLAQNIPVPLVSGDKKILSFRGVRNSPFCIPQIVGRLCRPELLLYSAPCCWTCCRSELTSYVCQNLCFQSLYDEFIWWDVFFFKTWGCFSLFSVDVSCLLPCWGNVLIAGMQIQSCSARLCTKCSSLAMKGPLESICMREDGYIILLIIYHIDTDTTQQTNRPLGA